MKKILLRIYTIYGFTIFCLVFLLLLPFFLLAIFVKPLEKSAGFLNHVWARFLFFLLFLNRTKVKYHSKIDPKRCYIFCANHTSYLDIPSVGLINHNYKFIGKSSLKKVPIWGYMYSKLHILVNRENMRSRHQSWLQAAEAITNGFSIVFFPEGGIYTKNPPQMTAFKDGSFRIAVNEQIPIVPIAIPYNHLLLPDASPLTMHPGLVRLDVLEPIWPSGTDDAAVQKLKEQTKMAIEEALKPYGNR